MCYGPFCGRCGQELLEGACLGDYASGKVTCCTLEQCEESLARMIDHYIRKIEETQAKREALRMGAL